MPMKFSQIDGMVKLIIPYTFVVKLTTRYIDSFSQNSVSLQLNVTYGLPVDI